MNQSSKKKDKLGIVTKNGDIGLTSLSDGTTVSKSNIRVEAYGSVDELNSLIGYAIALSQDDFLTEELDIIQNDLHLLSSNIALPKSGDTCFLEERISKIEDLITKFEGNLPPLKNFILYRGNQFSSFLNVLRSVARRAERRVVELNEKEGVDEKFIIYLNRLSDLFFIMSRVANKHYKIEEKLWKK